MHKSIMLPGSKSISARVLIMRFLAKSDAVIEGLSDSEDTLLLQQALRDIHSKEVIDVGASGANLRFLLPLLCLQERSYTIIGKDRIYERTIQALVEVLYTLGADIKYLKKVGFAPVQVNSSTLKSQDISIEASESSQFISALLMIAPYLPSGLEIELKGKVVSESYIHLTLQLMRELGASIIHKKNSLEVKKSSYQFPQTFQIEKDWSAAAYWFLYVSMHPKSSILLETLNENNLQGDTMQLQWYAQLNVESTQTKEGILLKHKMQSSSLNEHTYNMKDNPDLFPSLVINLAFLQQKAIFYNISHIRIKESDRIQAIAEILDSLGAECRVDEDTFYLEKGIDLSRKDQVFTFSSHKDHRIAMTLGILRTYFINIQIDDEECVIKSYPNFWQDLAKVQFTL